MRAQVLDTGEAGQAMVVYLILDDQRRVIVLHGDLGRLKTPPHRQDSPGSFRAARSKRRVQPLTAAISLRRCCSPRPPTRRSAGTPAALNRAPAFAGP